MKHAALRVGRIIAGVLFLVLGVLGLFLPILQGILFLMIGLAFLSSESVYARRCLDWLKSRFPRHARAATSGEHRHG